MLLNTYTAKGRAVARTLSTFELRDEMRIVSGACNRITLTTERGSRPGAYPLRVSRWLETFLLSLPTAPADTALVEDGETFHACFYSIGQGEYLNGFYWIGDAWPVFRALVGYNTAAIKAARREMARLKKALAAGMTAEAAYLAQLNDGEGRTV